MPALANIMTSKLGAPVIPAPIPSYPQFHLTTIPEDSEATRAYRGYIRPFSDDETARSVLRAIEANVSLTIASGRISADVDNLSPHPYEEFLIDMAVPCTIVVLEFEGREHPRSYLIDPPMTPRLSENPHLRKDKSLRIEGRLLPALCVYSGSFFQYSEDAAKNAQFLDQTATYLAKHLIWMRSRMLFRRRETGTPLLARRRRPGEKITTMELKVSKKSFWHGYWPGQAAPMGPNQHLACINPEAECWCWSGERYKDCCLPKERAYINSSTAGCPTLHL